MPSPPMDELSRDLPRRDHTPTPPPDLMRTPAPYQHRGTGDAYAAYAPHHPLTQPRHLSETAHPLHHDSTEHRHLTNRAAWESATQHTHNHHPHRHKPHHTSQLHTESTHYTSPLYDISNARHLTFARTQNTHATTTSATNLNTSPGTMTANIHTTCSTDHRTGGAPHSTTTILPH